MAAILQMTFFKGIFSYENMWSLIKISTMYVPGGSTENKATLVKVMAWRRTCDKPESEPMVV